MKNANDSLHYLRLQAAKGVGAVLQRKILRHLKEHDLTLTEFFAALEEKQQSSDLSEKHIEALLEAERVALDWQMALEQKGVKTVGWLDNQYPENLRRVLGTQAPPILHFWGNETLLEAASVGFCGARNVSKQGIEFAEDTARQVISKKWTVVSGHARGVDIATHQTALEHNGCTIIVIPEGVLNFQLRSSLKTVMKPGNIMIISEFQPNARWSVANAMTRNRTICGLSDAMIVVEAGMKGGTFEAGKFALKAKVPLFVADYAHPAPSAAGNPYFLQKGAIPIRRSTETNRANLSRLFEKIVAYQKKMSTDPPKLPIQNSLFSELAEVK